MLIWHVLSHYNICHVMTVEQSITHSYYLIIVSSLMNNLTRVHSKPPSWALLQKLTHLHCHIMNTYPYYTFTLLLLHYSYYTFTLSYQNTYSYYWIILHVYIAWQRYIIVRQRKTMCHHHRRAHIVRVRARATRAPSGVLILIVLFYHINRSLLPYK